jgi:adenine deaminase
MGDYDRQRESPVSRLLPRLYRDVVWHPIDGLPFLRTMSDADFARVATGRAGRMQMVRALHAAGVAVLAGTDVQTPFVVPGASLHEELRLLVEAGIPVEEVWALATRGAGEFLGVPLLGTVQVGAPADLLLFRDDPTLDLAALATLEAVVSGGRLYSKEDIDTGFARYQAQFEGFFFDRLSVAMGRFVMRRFFD